MDKTSGTKEKPSTQSILPKKKSSHRRYVITGLITLIPLWITWFVLDFVFKFLSDVGTPWVNRLSKGARLTYPNFATWLEHPWFLRIASFLLILLALYILGFLTTQVIGRKILAMVDNLMARIPIVQSVYGSTKKFLNVLQSEPDKVQRVVLINFPSKYMKTVGFVTTTFEDDNTGRALAAVYVPTTPNPTSGYLEIVPLEDLTSTDWSMEEAMTFIISGGAVAPDRITFE